MQMRRQTVGTEGFTLPEVSRDIERVDTLFRTLGNEFSPVQLSVDRVREAGRVAIGDFGCGVGKTVSTWFEAICVLAPCSADQVTGVGVTRKSYAMYRDDKTAKSWNDQPNLSYLVRDITRGVSEIPDGGLDVAIAYASAFYWTNPTTGLRTIRRTVRPGGIFMFNITDEQNRTDGPFYQTMRRWEREGAEVTPVQAVVTDGVSMVDQVYYGVRMPV